MRHFNIALLAALLVAGCSGAEDGPIAPPPESATPGAEPMSWSYAEPADGPRLVLGEPQTDNTRLMFRCGPRSGQVSASYVTATVNPAPQLVLMSGGARVVLEAAVEPTELGHESAVVSAVAPIDEPVLADFRRTGKLALYRAGELVEADAEGAERAAVSAFFNACPR